MSCMRKRIFSRFRCELSVLGRVSSDFTYRIFILTRNEENSFSSLATQSSLRYLIATRTIKQNSTKPQRKEDGSNSQNNIRYPWTWVNDGATFTRSVKNRPDCIFA